LVGGAAHPTAATWEQLFLTAAKSSTGEQKEGEDGDQGEQLGGMMDDNDLSKAMTSPDAVGRGADGAGDGAGGANNAESLTRYFDGPPTWVGPLSLPRSRYLLKYPPHGKRTVQYCCAKTDHFARRVNSQCMVMRITTYLDRACTIVQTITEWFENRQDKLYKRSRHFLNDRRYVSFLERDY
jgi:hypothetical protein